MHSAVASRSHLATAPSTLTTSCPPAELVSRDSAAQLPARLVAELGDGAACCKLVARVVRRHSRRLPIARFLQFDQAGAGCCERLRGADP